MDKYPYSLLKRDERGYTILLLRDQQGIAFTAIAKELGLAVQGGAEIQPNEGETEKPVYQTDSGRANV